MILAVKFVFVGFRIDFIDIQVIVMRPHSKKIFTGRIFGNFTPIFRVLQSLVLFVEITQRPHAYFPKIIAQEQVIMLF